MRSDSENDRFLPTRQSLLSRLKDQEDQAGWRKFFDTYWRLIYGVARKAGLSDSESQDLVQETLVVVARHMPEFRYDPARGSFKGWLHSVIRSRLSEHFRRARRTTQHEVTPAEPAAEAAAGFWENVPDPAASELDQIWQAEWERNLLDAALRRVRAKVSARQYLIFSLATLKETSLATIRRKLDVNVAQIYLAKHRVGKLVRAEVAQLRREVGEAGP